jgi:DNA-binding NtrC family response regulator
MSDNLDVIVLDDDPQMCSLITEILKDFYSWGDVHSFTKYNEALAFCKKKRLGMAIFILDVYLDKKTAFDFLDQISDQCAWASEDTVMITGNASDDVVNMCIASNISYLIEKPIKVHALKLAVRAIVGKYLRFAKRLLGDSEYAHSKNLIAHPSISSGIRRMGSHQIGMAATQYPL